MGKAIFGVALFIFILLLTGCSVSHRGSVETGPASGPRPLSLSFRWNIGGPGQGEGEFNEPGALSIDPFGNVYVADTGNHRVQIFDAKGGFVEQIGRYGVDAGYFFRPSDIDATNGFLLYVADTENGRLQSFHIENEGRNFTFSRVLVDREELAGIDPSLATFSPVSLVLAPTGNLIVGDYSRGVLLFLDRFSRPEHIIGAFKGPDFRVTYPADIVVGKKEVILVSDRMGHRITRLGPFGDFLDTIGGRGSGPGEFSSPGGLCTDRRGNLFVADEGNGRIVVFDSRGEFVTILAASPGEGGSPVKPRDLLFTAEGLLLVLDSGRCRLTAYAVGYSG